MSPRSIRPHLEALDDRVLLSGMPALTMGDATIVEGDSGTRYAALVVSLSWPSAKTVAVTYGTADGTARAGRDYAAASGKLSFAPGETSKTVLVPVKGDRSGEVDEQFFVDLGGARNAKIADGWGAVTILDDEPRLRIDDVAMSEGNDGTRLFTFTVSLSAAYDQAVWVAFATADDTATTADHDYVASFGRLTFTPGETTKTITVEVAGDIAEELDETFFVNLSGASSNALLIYGRGLGSIHDDDMPGLPPPPEGDCNDGPYGCQ